MPTSPVTLIKGDKTNIETDYRDALPVNMYAVKRNILGASGYMLCYPGLSLFATGSGADRGATFNERFEEHYRISGTRFIKVNANNTITDLGAISGFKQGRLEDCYSFNTQGIVADGNFYLYDPVNGLQTVTDPDVGSPIDGVWIDGYYFLTDGEYVYHTDLSDETAIDPLKFATAEFMPDPSLGVAKTQDNKVMIFGRYTIEYFVNVATANFAFQRVETRAQKIGIVATHAKCEGREKFYILGGRRFESVAVHAIGIGSSQKISTREVDKVIEQYSEQDLYDARLECRIEKDTSFILIHLPNETLCFNETVAGQFGIEAAWCILRTDITSTSLYRAINGVFDSRLGFWIYGDKRNSSIGKLDNSVFTHYDEVQEWILFTPFLKLEKMSIDKIEIETIPGFTSFINANVAFSLTYDGVTYSTEYWQNYGEPQEYGKNFILRQIGYVENWVGFKFRGATKSRMAFALMNIDYA